MGAGHEHLYLTEAGPLHRFAPHCKLVGAILLTFASVPTPREQIWALGFIADLIAVNRRLLEDIQLRARRAEFDRR